VAGGTLADAQSPPADDRPHLLVVPQSPEGKAALDRSDARVVARYEEFTLVEAAGGDDARLSQAGADRRDDMREVSLPSTEFDPRSERASLAAKSTPDPDAALAVVQFVGPVKDAWLARLEDTGARVVQYASQNAYLVHADGAEVARLAGLVGTDTAVRAVTPVRAGDKVDDGLTSGGVRTVAVQTVAGEPGAEARRDALTAGPSVLSESAVGELRTQFVRIDGAAAAAIAEDPGVVAIIPWSPPRLLDERAARIVGGNLLSSGPGYLEWLTGEGFPATTFNFTIDLADQGLDNGSAAAPDHTDFYENGVTSGNDRVTYAVDYTSDGGPNPARDCGGHGTNVASIAAGFGTAGAGRQDSAGFRHGMGIAPRARIGASKIFTCTGDFGNIGSFATVVSAAYGAGAAISNNSWGFRDPGEYGAHSQEFDALVRDAQPGVAGNQQMVEVFAAGNDGEGISGASNEGYGTVGSPGTAKNVITVGASESVRSIGGADSCGVADAQADNSADIIDFSSRGPTDDGRLKPDLVAPGTHVVGARPQHSGYTGGMVCGPFFDGLYSLSSGTSQAVPEVAGAAALIRDWYRREHGGGTVVPSPAMTKAILANTATDLAGGDSGKGAPIEGAPNTDQGWGRVNMGEVLDATPRAFLDQGNILSNTGQSVIRAYQVQDSSRPVKITLAWTDPPGMLAGDALVNNLDLVVEAGGRTYNGNVFSRGVSEPGGTADPRNNLESVFLPPGTPGPFAVRVVGTNIAGNGVPGDGDATDQDFALVVSNGVQQASAPVLVHHASSVHDSGGDGDGALELGERFELQEQLRNAGNATASGVSGTLPSSSDITFTQGSSSWPNLAAGETRANTTPFAGHLSSGVSCGAEVAATLNATTLQGQHSVPIGLPTGVPQPPTVVPRVHSPAAPIPDDNGAGVTSTIQVTNPGRIKDLNVRIDGIAHTFVGDLRIDLTGPDGTTVKLAEHPGGPDNSGDNLIGTVFDDEAGTGISAGSPPYTGSFRPQNDQLSRFDGKQRQGTWMLRVRDLFEDDTGTLSGWGTETQSAGCDFGGAGPDTTIDSKPSNPSNTRVATFGFSSPAPGASFECKLDAGDFAECASPRSYTGLADGLHTFSVRAVDGTGNVDTTPASYTWQVSAAAEGAGGGAATVPPVDTTAPHFAVAPTEEHLTDALKRGLTVLAGCSSACSVSAALTMPAAKARRAGLRSPGRRTSAFTLGKATVRLRARESRAVTLRLTRAVRAATRDESSLKAALGLRLSASGRAMRLRQAITLNKGAGLRRVVARGLRLRGICSESCTLRGSLDLARRDARRVGLSAPGSGPVKLAGGDARASLAPSRLSLMVESAHRRALRRLRRTLTPTLRVLIRGATGPEARATRRLVLRP
jgi:subtilisin-like proprotein convertase family protein